MNGRAGCPAAGKKEGEQVPVLADLPLFPELNRPRRARGSDILETTASHLPRTFRFPCELGILHPRLVFRCVEAGAQAAALINPPSGELKCGFGELVLGK